MNIKDTIKELKERLQSYLSQIEFPCLEYTPYIVEVGALTVGTDEMGKVITQNKYFPMQFSESAVKTILSMTFKNCFNEIVTPKVYGKQEWYSEQIERLKFTINEFEKLDK